MTDVPVLVRWWGCPSCRLVYRTDKVIPNRFHNCPAHGGVTLPLVAMSRPDDRPDAKHVLERSQDYSYGEREGLTGVHTVHGDGRVDATVFAPTATAGVHGEDANQPPRPVSALQTVYFGW